jgi:hypothetical protein
MALESPLLSPPGNIMSSFSPYTDFSMSPNSPATTNSPRFQSMYVFSRPNILSPWLISCDRSARSSAESSSLRPKSSVGMDEGLSPNGLQLTSPSDMVGPSPVTSNGTETTEIEDEASDDVAQEIRATHSRVSEVADSISNVCPTC